MSFPRGEWETCNPGPQPWPAMGLFRLNSENHDVIRLALMEQIDKYVEYLNDPKTLLPTASYWATELWAIDRGLRALGIDS